jgi:hypothetical protein
MSLVDLDSRSFRTTSSARLPSSESDGSLDEPPDVADDDKMSNPEEEDLVDMEGVGEPITGDDVMERGREFGISDIAEVYQLKRVFAGMEEDCEQKLNAVNVSKSDLKFCRERLETLELKRTELEEKLSNAIAESNRPTADLTRAQLLKVVESIERELELELSLKEALKEAELMILRSEMEMSSYIHALRSVEEDEADIKAMKMENNQDRLLKEKEMMDNYLARKRALERKQRENIQHEEEQRKKALLEAKKAHEVTTAFMQESLAKEKLRKESKEAESRLMLEKRIEAVLSLKKNIDANRDALKKAQSIRQTRTAASTQKDSEIDIVELTRQRRMDELSKKIDAFERAKHEREVDIVDKLIREEERLRKMKDKLNEPHWKPRETSTKPQETVRKGKLLRKGKLKAKDQDEESEVKVTSEPDHVTVDVGESREGMGTSGTDKDEGNKTSEHVLQPVFEGLWSGIGRTAGVSHLYPSHGDQETEQHHKHVMSKMEQDILQRHHETQRKLITQKQVVAGIEFKGPAFKSSPEVVEFKDFQPGKEYRRTLQLTNISYTVNTCKMVGLTEELKDFVTIQFIPPGPMSAGIACSMVVKFEPQIERDLYGEIEMLAQTGPFSIPIRCLKKRCVVEISDSGVDFDKVCIGESVTKKIVLKNIGALGTGFQITKQPLMPGRGRTDQGTTTEGETTSVADILRGASPTMSSSVVRREEQGELTTSKPTLAQDSVLDITKRNDEATKELTVTTSVEAEPSTDPPEEKDQRSIPSTSPLREKDGTSVPSASPHADKDGETTPISRPPGEKDVVSEEEGLGVRGSPLGRGEGVSSIASPPHSPPTEFTPQLLADVYLDPECGLLEAHSEAVLHVTFSPGTLGKLSVPFSVEFSDEEVDNFVVLVEGACVDIPVSVEHEIMDFQICEVGRLYQNSLNFTNSSSKSLSITFQVPKANQAYLDIVPEKLSLKPHSTTAAQIKFSPNLSLCSSSEDPFRVEVTGRIPNQTLPVKFSIVAVLTRAELEIGKSEVDFGWCGTQESVLSSLDVTNKSLLPQEVGFVELPNIVDVQPCDGFLTLLPLETVSFKVIVSPTKPGPFSFNLTCMTAGGKKYSIPCKGTAVQSPLRLDANTVYFAGTPVYSHSVASVTLKCDKTKDSSHRGSSRSFEFCLPKSSPVSISPLSGVITEGKKQKIEIQFHPKLDKEVISAETDRLIAEAEEERRRAVEAAKLKREEEAKKEIVTSQKKGRKTPSGAKGKPQKGSVETPVATTEDTPLSVKIDRSQYVSAAQQELLAKYSPQTFNLRIPCFVSVPNCSSSSEQKYRQEEAIFLDISARSVRPSLIVASQHGQAKMDFGTVVVGERVVKEIHITNISESAIGITTPLLDPMGPFQILNTFRKIDPGGKHRVVVAFAPQEATSYFEPIDLVYGEDSFLRLTFTGVGVDCDVHLEGVEEGGVDFGHTLSGDVATRTLKLKNSTAVPVGFGITLLSHTEDTRVHGVSNFSGNSVFEFNPSCGEIPSGTTRDITVTFLPDHPSLLYANKARIRINSRSNAFEFYLKGKVWETSMYLLEREACQIQPESLLPQSYDQPSLVVNFVKCLREDSLSIDKKQVEIGSIKSTSVKKNGGEFSFDPIQGTDAKCFAIEPMKATVEGGGHKTVTLSFCPPKGESHSSMDGTTTVGPCLHLITIMI